LREKEKKNKIFTIINLLKVFIEQYKY